MPYRRRRAAPTIIGELGAIMIPGGDEETGSPPAAPSYLTANADSGYDRIILTWTDNSDDETGFIIQRSPDGAAWVTIDTVGPNLGAYTDVGLVPGDTYYYQVCATNEWGDSAYTASANARVWSPDQIASATLKLWLESDAGLYQDSGGTTPAAAADDPVGLWQDQSGNNYHFNQATDNTYRPLLKDRIFGVRRGLLFDGSNDVLNSVAASTTWKFLHDGTQHHIFMVYKSNGIDPNAFGVGFGNAAASSTNVGFAFYTDDRHASSIHERLQHVIYKGTLGQYLVNNVAGDGYGPSNKILIMEAKVTGTDGLKIANGQTKATVSRGTASASNPTYNAQLGALGNSANFGQGYVGALLVFSGALSDSDLAYLRQYLEKYREQTAYESFVDTSRLEAVYGVTQSVRVPTKYSGNPVFTGGTWDTDKMWTTVIKIGATYYMWYGCFSAAGLQHTCYATSADGITWTRPNLGLVTYGGNTNNNILLAEGRYGGGVWYDASSPAGEEYKLIIEGDGGTLASGAYLYKSADGINFTLAKTIANTGIQEGKAVIKLPDGRWAVFICQGQLTDTRSIHVYVSETTSIAGNWYSYGVVIPTEATTNQKYALAIHEENGTYYAWVMVYNVVTEQIDSFDLYTSYDGLDYTLASRDWLNIGASGAWDDEMLINGGITLTDTGSNIWRAYYAGTAENHAHAVPRNAQIGFASIDKGRIGQVTGTGEVVTAPFYNASGKLYLNAIASSGSIDVEVINAATGAVLAGYAEGDCDTFSADTFSTEITWGGVSLPTGQTIKLRFILTGATLYNYKIS